jgi:4-amino-4-deoxy-L-arabinose transferase-like glycosyltransferase
MPRSETLHRPYALVAIASILCFASQLTGILLAPPNDHYLWDPLEYATLARNLYEHGEYGINRGDLPNAPTWWGENPSRTRQPLYPLFLIPFYWLPGKSLRVLQASQTLLNLGALWCVLAIARRIFGPGLWPGTGIALGLYFPLWFTSAFILSESLFTFLLALSMLFLQRSVENGRKKVWVIAATGALLGLCFLTRPAGLPACFCALLLLVYCHGVRRGTLFGSIMLGAFALVVLPWASRNYVSMGKFTPFSSEGGANLVWGAFRQGPRDVREFDAVYDDTVRRYGYYQGERASARFQQIALERIRSRPMAYLGGRAFAVAEMWGYFPGSFASPLSSHTAVFLGLNGLHYLLLVAAGVGLFAVGREWRAFMLLPAISMTVPFVFVGEGLSRYTLPAAPYLLVLAGGAVTFINRNGVQWVRWKRRPVSSGSNGRGPHSPICKTMRRAALHQFETPLFSLADRFPRTSYDP